MACLIRFSGWFTSGIWPVEPGTLPPVWDKYLELALYATLIGLLILERFGFYSRREGLDRGVRPVAFTLAVMVCYIFLMAWLFLYVHHSYWYSRLTIFVAMVLTIIFGISAQLALRGVMRYLVANGIGFSRTLLVGGEDNCRTVLDRLMLAHGSLHQVVGVMGLNGNPPKAIRNIPYLGNIKQFGQVLDLYDIDRVILALPEEEYEKAWSLFEASNSRGVDCRFIPELFDVISLKTDLPGGHGIPSICLGETPLAGGVEWVKQAFDILLASIALVLISPVLIFFSLLIKLDSRGPVFYRQERVGSDGRTFTMYKFRTMVENAERETGPVWATANDPRCTRVGRWLRCTNLDELPQIINVLKGEMSLVGPRPERQHFVDQFKQCIPQYMRRHMVKSGITGWAQVNGLRGNTSVEERTRYDIFYIENWSLLLDLKIMVRTLFSNKNAY